MKISVELTLTPLQDNFEEPIINFIKKLRASGLTILENPLSTQVYGDYDTVMQLLTSEVKEAFEAIDNGLLQMKIVKTDRSNYEPNF
ncbi:MAG: thiamine-binding protein [Tenacibaculum sp.]|nr:thiamine-binding protein [Tenacibaculum sp.]